MSLKEKLTLVTPLKIFNRIQATHWAYVQESYKQVCGDDMPEWIVDQSNGAINALNAAVRAVKTPYTMVALGDVCALTGKNFLALGVEAMEMDPLLVQMRYGDVPLSNTKPYNTSNFVSDGSNIFFKAAPEYPLVPLRWGKLGESSEVHVVWRYPMAAKAQKNIIGFAFWPCMYRTDILQRIVEEADKRRGSARTLGDWMGIINRTPDFGGWCLPEKGWPEGFEFLEDKKQGMLNLACYVAALGREEKVGLGNNTLPEHKDWENFHKTSRIEVKSVPPAGEITL